MHFKKQRNFTLDEIALFFDRDRSSIARQVQRVLSGDLNSDSVCAKFARTATDSKVYEATCSI